jgi:hypothetical protein
VKITRRRFLVVAVVTVAVIGGAWVFFVPPYGMTRSAYRSIRFGMPLKEVERLIGQPARDSQPLYEVTERQRDGVEDRSIWDKEWRGGDGTVLSVAIDQDGLVCEKSLYLPPFLDRLGKRLREITGTQMPEVR